VRHRIALLCFVLSLFASARALAGNDDELFVGNQAALMGGAVSATVGDSSSTWYNPAGLGNAERDQVDVSATVYTLRLFHSPVLIQSTDGSSTPGGVTELVVAPAQVAFVRRLRDGLALGVGYFVPRATNYTLRESLTAQNSDWQVALALATTQHIGALALGIAAAPGLRLGASLIGGYATASNAFMLFGRANRAGMTTALSSANLIGTQTLLTLEVALGMQLELGEHWLVGVSVRSPQLLLALSTDSLVNVSQASVDSDGVVCSAASRSTCVRTRAWTSRASVAPAWRSATAMRVDTSAWSSTFSRPCAARASASIATAW
jgi:long-subunit fatty acid transport protein